MFFVTPLKAGVIQFYNPSDIVTSNSMTLSLQSFLANDPVSLSDFFDDWHGKYNYKNGQNLALLDSRLDIGYSWKGIYLGYFYQYNVFIDTNEEFTNLFYQVKNKNSLVDGKKYDLSLEIEGIKQHGVVFSKSSEMYVDDSYSVTFGGAFYVSYALDMQEGNIAGYAKANGNKDYEIVTNSSYNYTHNYLYDLDVSNSHGYGVGSHLSLVLEDKDRDIKLLFLANDIFSRIYWKDLPYSKVFIKTQNKTKDADGYTKYTPMVSGLEKYQNYIQKISSKYKIDASVLLDDTTLFAGVDFAYGESFPYIGIAHKFDEVQSFEFMHESRFGSFGFGYGYKNFKVSIVADEFSDNSSFGLNSSFIFNF